MPHTRSLFSYIYLDNISMSFFFLSLFSSFYRSHFLPLSSKIGSLSRIIKCLAGIQEFSFSFSSLSFSIVEKSIFLIP